MLRRGIMPLLFLLLISGCNSPDKQGSIGGNALLHSFASRPENGHDAKMVRRGLPGDPRTLDPQLADDEFSFQVVRDLYEGLTAENSRGNIVPGAADSWRVNNSGTVYTFHLRPNAKWSDGTKVTAQQFADGLRRAVDPRTSSGSAELLSVIKGATDVIAGHLPPSSLAVSTNGDSVLQIELARPAPYVLQILSQPISAPMRYRTPSPAELSSGAVTDGPFVLTKREYGSYIELQRNPFYWASSTVKIQRVRYLIAESEPTELNEYLANQLDITYTIPVPDLDRLRRERPAEVQLAPILATFYLAINMAEPPFNSNVAIRQALSMGIDRNLIAERIMPSVLPAYSYVPPGVQNYTPHPYQWSNWPRQQRIKYARELLSRAGYTTTDPLHVRIYYNNDETVGRVILAIANSWKENLGVVVTLISDEFRVFLERRKEARRWDVARFGWNADYDDAASFLEVFADDSPQNDEQYKDTKYNSLIRAARVEPDVKDRQNLLEKAESVLMDDYVVMPIYFYEARRLVKPSLGGATITPMNHTYSKFLYWESKTH